MKHNNVFIYYGAKITKTDYENLINKLGFEKLYETIHSKGLTFRDVGEIGVSGEYIIGREIAWKLNEPIILKRKDSDLTFNDNNINLGFEVENDIRQKLLEINITNYPEYYVFSSIDDWII